MLVVQGCRLLRLWFDVEMKQDTTEVFKHGAMELLWFDVEMKQDTTAI